MRDLAEVEGPSVVVEDESKRGKLGVTNNLILCCLGISALAW